MVAPAFLPAGAHCPGTPPEVRMEYPSEGVAIHQACYAEYASCFVDTFYRADLMEHLVSRYRDSRYAVFAYVDSVHNYLTLDTVFYRGEVNYIDTFTTETIRISIHTTLKDSLPISSLTYTARWLQFRGNPFATTFTTLRDTPFVAFFNEYDTLAKIGIGPMDGCFFEPTILSIYDGHIHKKGAVGERMPGIRVKVEDFLAAVGHEPVAVPPVSILARRKGKVLPSSQQGKEIRYDAMGRRNRLGVLFEVPDKRLMPMPISRPPGSSGPDRVP